MKRYLLIPIALIALAAGCDESYDAVNGSNDVLVRDAGDKIDGENIRKACEQKGQHVVKVRWVGNGKQQALVSCAD